MLREERLVMEESMLLHDQADIYNDIALSILDDQGRVEVAELVESGEYDRAKLLLVVHADRLCETEHLMFTDREAFFAQLGLSPREVEEIRDGGGYIGMRGILEKG